MSGYLEVKYPFRSNLGLNPFKSWKRQWCILRPSPTCTGGGSLAVYCSEAGAPAGTVELPLGCVVRRAKSRSRPHAFAVFSADEPRKPRILLAAQTLNDAHVWMEKIRGLLSSSKLLGSESSLKDTYSVTIVPTNLSRKCGLSADSNLTLSSAGLVVSRGPKLGTVLDWRHVRDVLLVDEDTHKNRTCVVVVDSEFSNGAGELRLWSPLGGELAAALRRGLAAGRRTGDKRSRSEGDLRSADPDTREIRRSSWYSGPSEVSLDDIDLVMSKESKAIPLGQLSRCAGAGDLLLRENSQPAAQPRSLHSILSFDDSMSDRRSLLSVASGIYEEIPDVPEPQKPPAAPAATVTSAPVKEAPQTDTQYCAMSRELGIAASSLLEEPAYESVSECVYATMRRPARRHPPPPLPPRLPFGSAKLGESWNSRMNSPGAAARSTRHGSLGSLPRCCAGQAKTLPKFDKTKQPFSVFRKRLKSDSRIVSSPKSETAKENKDVESKKKRFEFTPTRDIFKSFKVGRKMKNLKITGALAKGETKSCEFLDESEHVAPNRCSKSVECLEDTDELDSFDADLSISLDPTLLPHEIVQLILRAPRRCELEGDYLPMSPGAPPVQDHYMVMSPRPHVA